jgi:hypothetical protein
MLRRREPLVWLAGLTAAVVAAVAVDAPGVTIDNLYFLNSARTLLSAHWLSTFGDPGLQSGPLQILLIGCSARLGAAVALSQSTSMAIGEAVSLMALLLLAARRVVAPGLRAAALAAVAVAALGSGLIHSAYFYGHPAQVIIPCCWLLGAQAARGRRGLLAGIYVGVAACFETWGVLGIAVVFLAAEIRSAARGLASLTTVLALVYGPFVLLGPFRMFEYRWRVGPHTLASLVVGTGEPFSWSMRLAQGGASLLAGVAAALLLRRFRSSIWLVPLAIASVRIVLDPSLAAWYLLAPQAIAVLGAAEILTARGVREQLAARLRPAGDRRLTIDGPRGSGR